MKQEEIQKPIEDIKSCIIKDKLLLFVRANCPICPAAKRVAREVADETGMELEVYDVDTVEGRAEAAFHDVMSTPTLIWETPAWPDCALGTRRWVGEMDASEILEQIRRVK